MLKLLLLCIFFVATHGQTNAHGSSNNLRHHLKGANGRNGIVDRRHLKTNKSKKGEVVDTEDPSSCSAQVSLYECDDDHVAICYKHDSHYHNKCVKVDDQDIFGRIPGVHMYKDKYDLVNCGCCPEEHLHNNVIDNIKFPKSYKNDPYCDRITDSPTSSPSSMPSMSPTSVCETFTASQFHDGVSVEAFCNSFDDGDKCCTEDEAGTTVNFGQACHNLKTAADDFTWLYYMRFYWYPKVKDPLEKLIIKMSNAPFFYGFEYLGVSEKLVQID